MIAYVKGKLVEKDPTYVIIDVGGLGYDIRISLNTFSALKDQENCKLFTYFHVKEDIQALYGFSEVSEKQIFMNLISISGIGPNTGLVMLSSLSPGEIQSAIINEDVKTIQGVKGIGAKTAQRVILELKDKMKKEALLDPSMKIPESSHNTIKSEALSALTTLGIPKAVAEKNIDFILREHGDDMVLEQLIKLALKRA